MSRPVCAGMRDIWDAADEGDDHAVEAAKRACNTCPIRQQCLDTAMDAEGPMIANGRWSIAGGLTAHERYALYRERRGLKDLPETGAAYRQNVAQLVHEGLTDRQISERLERSTDSVRNVRNRMGLLPNRAPFIPREEIAKLHGRRLTDAEIAHRLGMHPTSVTRARNRLGLKPVGA